MRYYRKWSWQIVNAKHDNDNDDDFNYYYRPRRMIVETDEQIYKQIISNWEALKENVPCLPF